MNEHAMCSAWRIRRGKRHWHVWGKTPEIAGCPNGRGVCLDPYLHVLHSDEFKEEGKNRKTEPSPISTSDNTR